MNSFRVLLTSVVGLCSELASKQAEPRGNGHLNIRAEESSTSFHVTHFSPRKQTRSVKTSTDTFRGSSKDDLHQGSTCFSTVHRGRKATLPVTTRTACRPPPPRQAGKLHHVEHSRNATLSATTSLDPQAKDSDHTRLTFPRSQIEPPGS